ncbi:uncharacterized protein LOC121836120 [Ixodes scapularis]|uniref:uncharacterized protein LOC121832909 n=1 Tax=Ixodes scapularis TaxID=6945 RepID=UPI001AA0061E|nr:uncharacterized protein LOC121832909 [Ixodes scapularis]XP_042146808.1 uncharacterized protein LOC121836120 [Ixodes scapularis]
MLSITKSKKDHPLLQHNGYSYRLDRLNENTGQRTWRCSKKSCSGRATTAGWDSALTLVKTTGEHQGHLPNPDVCRAEEVIAAVKEKARTTDYQPRMMIAQATSGLTSKQRYFTRILTKQVL